MPDASQTSAGRPASREYPSNVRTAMTGQSALQQAVHLMEHLKKQLEELDRREANLNRQLIAFDNDRRGLRLLAQQLETQSTHREQQLAAREEDVLNRESSCVERSRVLDAASERLTDERSALEAESQGLRATIENELAEQRQELSNLRDALDRREADLETREAAIQQGNADLEKRIRLHDEHLSRLRSEVSVERAELDRDTARRRIWAHDLEQVSTLRLAQIRKLRGLLDRREASLVSEAELVREQQAAAAAEVAREREAVFQQQEELARAIDEHAQDVERHQEMLTLQAENFEGRRQRLDRLRDELDQERQESLESRLVVEQVYSQTVHALDVAAAQERVQNARGKLFEHYRELRDALTRRRQECEQAQRQLIDRRDSFQAERDEQLQRVAEREEQLAARMLEMANQSAEFAARQSQFAAARDRWRQDRLEAERIIRNLLGELERGVNQVLEQSDASSIQPASGRIVPLPPDNWADPGSAASDDETNSIPMAA